MICSWVEVGWISELTVVILVVQCLLCSLGNINEVSKMLLVGEVFVEVVLEVLDEIHVVLDDVISSHSCEREGVVVELPGMDVDSWFFTFSEKSIIDDSGISVSLIVKSS